MRFQILNSKQIDPIQWDHLVLGSTEPSLYNTFDYINLCEGDWEALVELKDNNYQCAMVFPYREKAWTKYIYQSPTIPYLRPIISYQSVEFEDRWKAHLETFQYVAKYFVRADRIKGLDLRITNHEALEIDLMSDYEKLASRYSRLRKAKLKQMKSSGQVIRLSDDLDSFIQYFKTFTLPKIKGMTQSQQVGIDKQWLKLKANGQLEIYFSSLGTEIVSGVLLGKYATTLYYLTSFTTPKGRELNGMTLLIDFVIKKYANSTFQSFDLGDAIVSSISQFKRGFGAIPYSVSGVYWNSLPWFMRIPKLILNRIGIAVGSI